MRWRERQLVEPVDPRSYGKFSGAYFIRCGAFVKIGMSDDIRARFRVLKCSTPYDMTPLGFIAGAPVSVEELETELHAQFGELRHRGEWFRYEAALVEFIESNVQPWPTSDVS